MGRPRKPDALKAAQGNPGKRKLAERPGDDSASVATAPANRVRKPPIALSGDGLKVWHLLAADMAAMSFVRHQDGVAFARYCEYLGLWIELKKRTTAKSIVAHTKSAHVDMDRLDKKFQALLLLDRRLVELEDRFGLNPRARQTILVQLAAGGAQHPGGDLFGNLPNAGKGDGESHPATPAGGDSPIGFLN